MKTTWREVLGPWPIRPWPVAVIVTLYMFSVTTTMLAANSTSMRSKSPFAEAAIETILPSLVLLIIVFVTLSTLAKIQQSNSRFFAISFYVAVAIVGAVPVSFRFFWTPADPPLHWQIPNTAFAAFVFSSLLNWFIQATIGLGELRLRKEIQRTQQALDEVELQRNKLVETQEQVRNQIAEFLHDNLQTRLVVLGLQMRTFIASLPKSRAAVANSLLAELERIRGIDVRSAARVLRPELEAVSLATPLEQLVGAYREAMVVELHLDKVASSPWLPDRLKLAAYRIVEQALLNAAAHGKAESAKCTLKVESGKLMIEVSNVGLTPGPQQDAGAGFAVIQSWVELYSGEWALAALPAGATLTATLRDEFLIS